MVLLFLNVIELMLIIVSNIIIELVIEQNILEIEFFVFNFNSDKILESKRKVFSDKDLYDFSGAR